MATVFGALIGFEYYFGRPWPVAPEIHPRDSIVSAPLVLPFTVQNKSIFSMEADPVCGVDLIYFVDANGLTGLLRDVQFRVGAIHVSGHGNYTCDASDYVRVAPDGTVTIGIPGGQFMSTPPSSFRPPITIVKMCEYVSGTYQFAGASVPFKTTMFQWPARPGTHQWIEGPISPEILDEAWIPQGSRLGAAWGLRPLMSADKKQFAPGALQCTNIE